MFSDTYSIATHMGTKFANTYKEYNEYQLSWGAKFPVTPVKRADCSGYDSTVLQTVVLHMSGEPLCSSRGAIAEAAADAIKGGARHVHFALLLFLSCAHVITSTTHFASLPPYPSPLARLHFCLCLCAFHQSSSSLQSFGCRLSSTSPRIRYFTCGKSCGQL